MIKTELFDKPYLPFEIEGLLPAGAISAGDNMQRASLVGGWKPRAGCTRVNTTAAASAISKLFFYKHPRYAAEGHLIAQSGVNLLSNDYSGAVISTVSFAAFANTTSKDSGTEPYWDALVGEDMILIGKGRTPIAFSGEGCRPETFLTQDASTSPYLDATLSVTVSNEGKVATIAAGASCAYYVCFKAPIESLYLEIGTGNVSSVNPVLSYWYNGTWAAATVTTDGTDDLETHDQDGKISFTTANTPEMTVLNNKMGYWYRMTFSGAIGTAFTIDRCRGKYSPDGFGTLSNKWDSKFRYITNCQFYDASGTVYQDFYCRVVDGLTTTYLDISEATTSDYLYFKTGDPICGIGFVIPDGYENATAGAYFDLLECLGMNSSGTWTTVGTLNDETKEGTASLAKSGTVWINDLEFSQSRSVFAGDPSPGYWYRLSWNAAFGIGVRIAGMLYASKPDEFPDSSGCIEIDGRLVLWGNEEYPNRLIRSAYGKPDELCDLSERYTVPFGGEDPIKCCVRLGDAVLVFKEKETYAIDREFTVPSLVAKVGIASPETLVVADYGVKSLDVETLQSVAIWQSYDGVYMMSEKGQIRKISKIIREYFDPQKSSYVGKVYVDQLAAYYNPVDDTYRLLLPAKELVFAINQEEWYPVWDRELPLLYGLVVLNEEEEYVSLGGTTSGIILKLDTGTTDVNAAGTTVTIDHSITTRFINLAEDIRVIAGLLRNVWGEFKENSGTIAVTLYTNHLLSGTTQTTPSTISLNDDTVGTLIQVLTSSKSGVVGFKLKFASSTSGQMMEIHSISYWVETSHLNND